jgi:hypothetical protein
MTTKTLYHRDDPATSKRAAMEHERSGARVRHVDMVVSTVWAFPGFTAAELHRDRFCTWELQEVRRRLTDAKNAGRLRRGPSRRCRVRGRASVTWVVNDSVEG